jgi:hypothetical protein
MTTPSFSLATEAWIPALTPDGYVDVSLADAAVRTDIIDVDSGDVLADAAVRRLLLATTIAARHERVDTATWIRDHATDFDILDPDRPFAQNPRFTAIPLAERPRITSQLYDFTAGNGSSGDYTLTTAWDPDATLPLADVARLVLVRQMFSAGGIGARLGKYTGTPKITSFQQSLHFNNVFAWVARPTLAASVETMADLLDAQISGTADLGTFHFYLPDNQTPGDEITNFGLLDMLTYPSRSLHLAATTIDGEVRATHLAVFEGLRLPRADAKTSPDVLDRQRRVFRHTTWWSVNDKTAPSPRGIRTAAFVREDWRHLLECYRTDDNPSIISPDVTLPDDADILLTTVAGDRSRIDNTVNWRLPAPRIDRDTVNTLVAASGTKPKDDDSLYGNYRRSAYGLASIAADRGGLRGKDATDRMDARHQTTFDRITRPIILDALTGTDTPTTTRARLAAAHQAKRDIYAADLAAGRPLGAAQVATMKTPDWATDPTATDAK